MSQPLFIMSEDQITAFGKKLLEDFIESLSIAAPQKIELITPDELCKRLNISIQTQIRYRQKGKLPWLEIGNQIRYDWNKVVEALEQKTIKK